MAVNGDGEICMYGSGEFSDGVIKDITMVTFKSSHTVTK
jgi:hypothetical protein